MALSKIIENSLADEAVSSAKLKDFSAAVDLNGVELVLDADADTSITADTDDRIDFKIAGVEHFSFSNSSGDTIIKPMVDAKDIKFQQYDGRTLLDINDGGFVGIANGATGPGEVRIFEDTDNGSNYVGLNAGSISSSFTLTLPTADGSSGQFLKTDGSGALSFDTVSSAADDLTTGDAAVTLATSAGNITIDAQGNDTDIILKGTDGSSDTTFLTIDGSAAGEAIFNAGIVIADAGNIGSASDKDAIAIGSDGDVTLTQDLELKHDGAILSFGADDDTTLTHTDGTGLTLNSTNKLCFNDATQFIQGASGTVLDIAATDEIELTATLIDVVGNLAGSGTGTFAGILKTDDTTEATSTTDGSLQTDGGLSVAKDIVAGDDIKLLSDAAVVHFGADSEVTLTHSADSGLLLKHTATADDKPINLVLQTGETDMAANDVIGKISWQAPDEGTGTDAILVSAAIQAVAEGDHSATSNATRLEFMTGASEAAATKMVIASDGDVGIGTTSPSFPLHVDGKIYGSGVVASAGNSFELSDNNVAIKRATDSMTLNTNGSARVTIDDNGHVTMAAQSAFLAKGSGTQANLTTDTTILFADEKFDKNGDYNASNSTFTAPVAGIYIFTTILRIEDFNNDASYVQISLEGANDQQQTIISGNYFSGDPTYIPFTISYIAECDANDTVTLRWKQSGGTTSSDLHNDSSFSGHLLS